MGFSRRRREAVRAPESPTQTGTSPRYNLTPPDSLPEARERVLRHVQALPHVDTGTAGAVDRIILGWLGQWLEQLGADRAEHRRVLDQRVVQATARVTDATDRAAHTDHQLRQAIQDHDRAYHLITGDRAPSHPVTTDPATTGDPNDRTEQTTDAGDQNGTVVDLPHRPTTHTARAVGD